MSSPPQVPGVEVRGEWREGYEEVLTEEALTLLARLQREFGPRRAELLAKRAERDAQLAAGALPDFLPETEDVRTGDWQVAPPAPGLVDRRVEITGPTDRKMVINALNCGAKVFMADFEDSNTPTFDNLVSGQRNLRDAWLRQIDFTSPQGKSYALAEQVGTLVVRNRGWHLPERHVLVDGEPVSGSLFDFCLYMTTSAKIAMDKGFGPYFYLPKMESHLEARLWNDVFVAGQEALGIPRGTIRATCLIETILAAFEMEEILYELREHSSGLNAGRWDYIFSMIKKFRTPASVTSPGVALASSSWSAVTWTSSRSRSSWFGRSPSLASNTSSATGTRSGCATHEPSKPSSASRLLSARTAVSAASLTSASLRLGMKAAMPPIACAPCVWQLLTSSSV